MFCVPGPPAQPWDGWTVYEGALYFNYWPSISGSFFSNPEMNIERASKRCDLNFAQLCNFSSQAAVFLLCENTKTLSNCPSVCPRFKPHRCNCVCLQVGKLVGIS